MSLGDNIKFLRESKNISISEMSKKLNAFPKDYIKVEKGFKKPDDKMMLKIASILEVSVKYINNLNLQSEATNQKNINLKNLDFDSISIEGSNKTKFAPNKKQLISKTDYDKIKISPKVITDINNIGPSYSLTSSESVTAIESDNYYPVEEKNISSKVLNWTSNFKYNSTEKTLFYTQHNTGLKVGDKVFIVNGNFDSNELIKKDKYAIGTDGYEVLYVDKCKIALDIDYNPSIRVYENISFSEVVKLFYVKNENDFAYVNSAINYDGNDINYTFGPNNDYFIYVDQDYSPILNGIGFNQGLTGAPGFYIKGGTSSWVNITTEIEAGDLTSVLSGNIDSNRLIVKGGDIVYNNGIRDFNLKEGMVYKYDQVPENDGVSGTYSFWVSDEKYNPAFITKANFRYGTFNGEWNSGLFGSSVMQAIWDDASWNLGTFYNSLWEKGTMDSIYGVSFSYYAELDESGEPTQKIIGPNNNYYGYNLIYNSNILGGTFSEGLYERVNIGSSVDIGAAHSYLSGNTFSNSAFIEGAKIINSNLESCEIENSDLINAKTNNSFGNNIKLINSTSFRSVVNQSMYLSDNDIKVTAYDEYNLKLNEINEGFTHKMYRFYISEFNFSKLNLGDVFYIKNFVINDSNKNPLHIFNRKFKVSAWYEYYDSLNYTSDDFIKRDIESGAFLNYNSTTDKYSIDIVMSLYDKNGLLILPSIESKELGKYGLSMNKISSLAAYNSQDSETYTRNIIDISKCFIIKSDFDSGVFENSDWITGDHIELNKDNLLNDSSGLGGVYDINLFTFSSKLIVTIPISLDERESSVDYLSNNDVVFLNNLYYNYKKVTTLEIENPGTSYSNQNLVYLNSDNIYSQPIGVSYSVDINSQIDSVELLGEYHGYEVGETFSVSGGNNDAIFRVGSIVGDIYKMPDSYRVVSFEYGNEVGLEYLSNEDEINALPTGGLFYSLDVNNRYGYMHRTKFKNSKISSGVFRRSYFEESLIQNETINYLDKDFETLTNLKQLIISDSIFKDLNNNLSNAVYMNSIFIKGSDSFEVGVVYDSVWDGLTFSNGLFKQSAWKSGVFEKGIFYNNRSFNDQVSIEYPNVETNRVRSYYVSGEVANNKANNRYSWVNGIFNSGDFEKSDWESGTFSQGNFYSSNFYDGVIQNGFIGGKKLSYNDTKIYGANIDYAVVLSAKLIASDRNLNPLTPREIIWTDGIFNEGVFGTDYEQDMSNRSLWVNGIFNGGQFISMAQWQNGIFNGGKFISGYGWTMSDSTSALDYSWQNGKFNGGEFGNSTGLTNSTWFTGDFEGGVFKGRVWNDGIFSYGNFEGSGGTYSAFGGTQSYNAQEMSQSFTYSFYGYWRNGVFGNKKDEFIKDKKIFTDKDTSYIKDVFEIANFKNALWEDGIFNHNNGTFRNSIWLNGIFKKGKFIDSSFNPFVIRGEDETPSFNNSDVTCVWEDGYFSGGDFFISIWNKGRFNKGDAYGMWWKDGICEYMNAFNIFWENGLWRNGNWYGSYINYEGEVTNSFEIGILERGAHISGDNKVHLWNLFEDSVSDEVVFNEENTPFSLNTLSDLNQPIIIGGPG